jgi:hypothetical protein
MDYEDNTPLFKYPYDDLCKSLNTIAKTLIRKWKVV